MAIDLGFRRWDLDDSSMAKLGSVPNILRQFVSASIGYLLRVKYGNDFCGGFQSEPFSAKNVKMWNQDQISKSNNFHSSVRKKSMLLNYIWTRHTIVTFLRYLQLAKTFSYSEAIDESETRNSLYLLVVVIDSFR